MSDNREPENNGNPWAKSLLVWGGDYGDSLLFPHSSRRVSADLWT